MRQALVRSAVWGILATAAAAAEEPAFSKQYLQGHSYPQEENERLVKMFHGLRVTDVVDGLDAVGLKDLTVMDPAIQHLWRDDRSFAHRIYGIAVTLRLVPPQEAVPSFTGLEDFKSWRVRWRSGLLGSGEFATHLKPDTVLVIDAVTPMR